MHNRKYPEKFQYINKQEFYCLERWNIVIHFLTKRTMIETDFDYVGLLGYWVIGLFGKKMYPPILM